MVHHLARFFLRYVLQKNVRQREYYLNKFWDVRYPKSTEFFELKLKVPMNFGVCVYVCVVLDMDAISLERWKLYKLLKSTKFAYYMYHHLAHENGNRNAGQNLNRGRTTALKESNEAKTEHLFFNLALLSLWGHS